MKNNIGQAISELKNKFEGGVSFNIAWFDLAYQAVKKMNRKINPHSNKRRVAVYGGVSTELPLLTCPDDIVSPAMLYPVTNTFGGRSIKYRAPKYFYTKPEHDRFTIDYLDGKPFIVANIDSGKTATVIEVTDPTLFTGVPLTTTLRNFLYGSNGLFGTFTDSAFSVNLAYPTSQSFNNFERGVVVVPFSVETPADVDLVSLVLKTDALNYFTVSSATAGLGGAYTRDWNLARLDMEKKVVTGTPDIADINSVTLNIKMKSGKTQEVTIDKVVIHQTHAAMFEYYSNKVFQDSTTGEFLLRPEQDTDLVMLTDDEYDIWFYEMCMLVVQDATYDGIDSKESSRFELALRDAYEEYNMKHPSMEEPVTYNISSDIDLESHYDTSGL